ncbi:UNVERIFIED_CONTAM: hypothetical protein RMT77_004063 [Armadillidium vulgare]
MTGKEEYIQLTSENVSKWSVEDVVNWLESVGLQRHINTFQLQNIDGSMLVQLSEEDLKHKLNVQIAEDVKKILSFVSEKKLENKFLSEFKSRNILNIFLNSENISLNNNRSDRKESEVSISSNSSHFLMEKNIWTELPQEIKPEYRKTLIAFFYLLFGGFAASVATVYLNSTIVVMANYPPLPDLFLDSFPYLWWAKPCCEVIMIILSISSFVIIYFHKHRSILARRLCVITGSTYLLRTLTILVTRLPVPSTNIICSQRQFKNCWEIILEAVNLFSRGGLQIQGGQTCGDYMFSGHTIVLTICNFFIVEYTKRNWYVLHFVSWILSLLGMFLILAAHAHYSIDIIIGCYVTARMFLCYHYLANNKLDERKSFRTMIWFPLFSYFEANVRDVVPNEYSNPLPLIKIKELVCCSRPMVSVRSNVHASLD